MDVILIVDRVEEEAYDEFEDWFKGQLEDPSLGAFGTFGVLL